MVKKMCALLFLVIFVSGCNNNGIPDEMLSFDYLDEAVFAGEGIIDEELTYSEVNGVYVHDFIKKNKEKHVRWTAAVHRVEDETIIELKEELLPTIYVNVTEPMERTVEIGEIVTVVGVLTGYGETFGKDPIWVVTPARLEEPTNQELEEVMKFRMKLEEH
ncbi:MAG: hypothetical protein LPK00_07390 [Bacillaceae bacterium]|nr:hypothetical protein [Bacillaceae bacterium]